MYIQINVKIYGKIFYYLMLVQNIIEYIIRYEIWFTLLNFLRFKLIILHIF